MFRWTLISLSFVSKNWEIMSNPMIYYIHEQTNQRERDRCQDKNTSQKDTRKSIAKKLIHDSCKNEARSAAAVIQMPIPVENSPGYTRIIKMKMHLCMRPNPVPTLPAT